MLFQNSNTIGNASKNVQKKGTKNIIKKVREGDNKIKKSQDI